MLAYLHDDGGVSPQERKQTAVIRWSRSSFSSHPVCFVSTDKSGWLAETPAIKRQRRLRRRSNACRLAHVHVHVHTLTLARARARLNASAGMKDFNSGRSLECKTRLKKRSVLISEMERSPVHFSNRRGGGCRCPSLMCKVNIPTSLPPLSSLIINTSIPWDFKKKKREKKNHRVFFIIFFWTPSHFSWQLDRTEKKKNERIVILNEKKLIKGAAADEIRGGFYVDQLVIPESQLLSSVTVNALWIGVFNHRCWIRDIGFERRHYQRHDISSAWVPGLDDLKMRFCLLLGFYLGRILAARLMNWSQIWSMRFLLMSVISMFSFSFGKSLKLFPELRSARSMRPSRSTTMTERQSYSALHKINELVSLHMPVTKLNQLYFSKVFSVLLSRFEKLSATAVATGKGPN